MLTFRHSLVLLFVLITSRTLSQGTSIQLGTMKECDKESSAEIVTIKDFSQKDFILQWTNKASAKCPGPGFPRITLWHDSVDLFVQIVSTDQDVPENYRKDPSWNLLGNIKPWVFLDVSDKARKQKEIAYSKGGTFHDNPLWGSKSLLWTARVYGLRTDEEGRLVPLMGLSWGFRIKEGDVVPHRPKALSPKEWLADQLLLEQVLRSWGKSPKLKFKKG